MTTPAQPAPKDNGGAAFPESRKFLLPGSSVYQQVTSGGMTLRDWFAGQALAGINANPATADVPSSDIPNMARAAYVQADACIAERTKAVAGGGEDAARLDWLAENKADVSEINDAWYVLTRVTDLPYYRDTIREAIDAAIAATKAKEGV